MLKSTLLPDLIQPYARACPAGADMLLQIAQNPELSTISENAFDLLEQFSAEPLVGYALLLAAERHHGQIYQHRIVSLPYLYHLVDVTWCLANVLDTTDPLAVVCGLWHDMLEDEKISEGEMRAYLAQVRPLIGNHHPASLEDDIVVCLKALIRPGSNRAASKAYYAGLAAAPPAARAVKAADLICNTSNLKAMHQFWYSSSNAPRHPRLYLIAKYVTEADRYIFHHPAFTALEIYPQIHNTLLGSLQGLLTYIYKEYPTHLGLLDQDALERYQASFCPAADRIQELSAIDPDPFTSPKEPAK